MDTEKTLMGEIARELRVDPAHPDLDQMTAAVAETVARAQKLARMGGPGAVLIRLRPDDRVPQMVMQWLTNYADSFSYDGRACAHVERTTPTTLFAVTPNRRLCDRCADRRARELAASATQSGDPFRMDCDFCGVPADLRTLRVALIPVVTVLVRAFGCGRCLA